MQVQPPVPNMLSAADQARVSRDLAEAARRLEGGEYADAHRLCLSVLQMAPQTGEAFLLLAVIAADHANHARAVALLDRAIAGTIRPAKALALKARSLIALHKRADAIEAAEAAAGLAPAESFTLDTIGVVFSRAGLHERATPFYAKAAAADGTAGQYYNLGAALQFLGRSDEARAAYRQCIAKEPDHARAWSGLMQITRARKESGDIVALEAAFEGCKADADDALNLGHALAKACEDIGDPASAMMWLGRAKAGKARLSPYDADFDTKLFAASARSAKLAPVKGFEAAAPIFIVGMPRTGTTLIDRILSSHSEITSAGELSDFALLLKRMTQTRSAYALDAETLDAAGAIDAAALGAAYDASVRAALGIEGRFIDKMPLNILLAPLILRALPNARVICLRRHPADTVLGNYRQLFATSFSYYAYAYGLEDTAHYYVQFDALVNGFAEALPKDRFCQISYEAVVDDIETEARRLLDFCALGFEPACLAFHENAAPVATASSAQVRQPLYRTALDRWKRYRPQIDPALDILVKAGCMSADEVKPLT